MDCPRCHSPAVAEARFCSACGEELETEERTSPGEDLQAAGETRLITALFADLSGSVAATHGLDPEAAAERVNEVLDVMAQAIVRYEGRIDRYLGDGVLAFFGTPQAHEDDPLRAISAALEIRDDLERRGFHATSGINTGEVYLGRIGSERHAEFSGLGPVINLAARLQSRAEPGQVLVGEATYRAARRAFEFRPLSLRVKGVPHPITAHLALEPLARPEKARGIEGVHVELVGRDEDLERLGEALAAIRSGHGRVVAVVGEAGIGKSRLVAELKRRVDRGLAGDRDATPDSPILWLDGRCLETTCGTSYAPFVDLLRSFFGDSGGNETLPDRVAGVVHGLVSDGALPEDRGPDVAALLTNLLSRSPDAERLFPGASPEQIRNQTFLALRDFLSALARPQPLVVFIEDLHWADALSLDLSALLMSATAQAPLLLLCAFRPGMRYPTRDIESTGAGRAGARFSAILLHPLTGVESDRLLESILRLPDFPSRLRESLLERAQGNPLFLEEMLRSLVDEGHLVRENGSWRVLPGIEAVHVPDSVQSIIQSRVDRLDADPRQVLQVATVIGRLFHRELLEAVVRTACDGRIDLDAALADLEDHELVYLERVSPEEYSFKHVFTLETVYGSLLRKRRAALHRCTAEAIETLRADRLEEHFEQLARHYDEAGVGEKATEYLLLAGEKSRRAFLNPVAIEYYERALERLAALDLPAGREPWRGATRARVREALGDLYELTGRHDEAIAGFQAALDDAGPANAVDRARILRKTGVSLQIQRRFPESLAAFQEALAVLDGNPPPDTEAAWRSERLDTVLGKLMLHYFMAAEAEIAGAIERYRDEFLAHGSPLQRGLLYRTLAVAGLQRERYVASAETVDNARAAWETIETTGVLHEIGHARFVYGFASMWAGRLDDAQRELSAALALAERIGDVTLQSRCVTYLALTHRKQGDVEAARRHALRALEISETGGMTEYLAAAHAHLAWAAGREGRWDEAEREGRLALELWEGIGGPYRLFLWMPVWPLLGVALARGRPNEAAGHARNLLDPGLQPMPEPLAAALDLAAGAAENRCHSRSVGRGGDEEARDRFAEVGELARPLGYL
ncbi:MAG: ATP-binding protein [Gemmatimonadota bacterium]